MTGCFTDTHHLEYPRRDYRTKLEKKHRELNMNKLEVCRAVHDAIHASGYVPDKPSHDTMAQEVWDDTPSLRSRVERHFQLLLGEQTLNEETA